MTPNTTPLHQFRTAVAQRLQTSPYCWGGSCGYELERKYGDLVQEYWNEGETVDDTAGAVNKLYMSRYRPKVEQMTRASLQAAGCRFDDLEQEVSERERDEWEGLADASY